MSENELEEVQGEVPAIPVEESPEEAEPEAPPVDDPPDPATLKAEIEKLEAQKAKAEADALKWRKEKAQARKEYFQERQQQQPEPPAPAEKPRPDPDSFDDYNDFVRADNDWAAEMAVERKKAEWDRAETARVQDETRQKKMHELQKRINQGFDKYADFEDVALAETVPITPMITDILAETENPEDVAYYLGKNHTEAIRISHLTPIAAARAIAKIESEIAGTTPAPNKNKKQTGAPPPINPVGSGGSAAVGKSLDKMTQAEFEAEMERRGAPHY